MKDIKGTHCWAKPISRTASAKRCASTPVNGRSIMWRITILQSSTQIPSQRCRKNWQGEPRNAKSSRSARKPNRANTAASTRSQSCLSAENAEHHTAAVLGRQAVKRKLYGAASTALTTAKILPPLTDDGRSAFAGSHHGSHTENSAD